MKSEPIKPAEDVDVMSSTASGRDARGTDADEAGAKTDSAGRDRTIYREQLSESDFD